MTRARRWWFEVERENDAVFVIFDYKGKGPSKLIPKKKNTPYSAVRKLETYDDSTHADKDLVKIVFSIPDEHPCKLSRSSFTWNKSEFSRKLRDFQTPVDFAEECNRLLKEPCFPGNFGQKVLKVEKPVHHLAVVCPYPAMKNYLMKRMIWMWRKIAQA
ncbi:uncharacterized protein [Ptychodera flava]|uniref:uncharacterized protein n=1 Tax=Ptychodera flava TaxID=63121 RepID=UPI003969FF1B